ncbi:MAG: ComF family protein, partial [Candidatus Methylomirabilales bacterium]
VPATERVHGRRLLLVDDVYTTGATVNECSRALRRAGAEAVVVFTLARAEYLPGQGEGWSGPPARLSRDGVGSSEGLRTARHAASARSRR